jgi:hypothetical protein
VIEICDLQKVALAHSADTPGCENTCGALRYILFDAHNFILTFDVQAEERLRLRFARKAQFNFACRDKVDAISFFFFCVQYLPPLKQHLVEFDVRC